MLGSVAQAVLQSSEITPEQLSRLTLHNHTWFHLSRHAGSFVAHNHPLASWSAVYCVRAGEGAPGHRDSGVLRFFDTRPGADAYPDATNRRLKAPFAVRPLEFRLEEGQIVVFPSYVFPEVAPFCGRDARITVATNCWFT